LSKLKGSKFEFVKNVFLPYIKRKKRKEKKMRRTEARGKIESKSKRMGGIRDCTINSEKSSFVSLRASNAHFRF